MSTKKEAWIVAASIEAVEELKDQGFCRCTSTLISLHQHAMNNLRSILQPKKLPSSSSAMVSSKLKKSSQSEKSLSKAMYLGEVKEEKAKQSEESLTEVMYLRNRKMSSASKAWAVATSIAAVEALKDQGFCRWNCTIRSLHQHGKNQLRPFSQAKKLSSPSSTVVPSKVRDNQEDKQSGQSLRKVMYLSSWGPY
ncbi:hypothetical protein SADUNF_Sadunf13G0114400 [Salix dunnii]|uniref:Uncharacterized protein n=1 Tax=Salix dunnii TaxID=1413687 RepID=A0A835JIG1_9ROSI|nr:hypothetical protein SADUNF_Sadunf13G0114400 [Salix dunnii]